MTSSTQARLLKELDLLVTTGLGVAPVAPALSDLLFKIMGAESGGMCWFSESGVPQGFYQQGSTQETEELFMNHYEELFVGPHEYTPFWSLHNKSYGVSRSWMADRDYLRSNTFNLLIKPNHCHFLLDAVVDLAGVPRLTACFFRPAQNPFTEDDVKKLTGLIPLLRRIVSKNANPLNIQGSTMQGGYLLVSRDGMAVEMIDTAAAQILSSVRLFDQNVSVVRTLSEPPKFVQLLCEQLRLQNVVNAKTEIATAGGSVVVSAKWLTSAPAQLPLLFKGASAALSPPDKKILVSVHFKKAGVIDVVRGIAAMELSPLQGRIAMYAAAGGSRAYCGMHHRVSKEALKKHLREIYSASRCADWHELTAALRAGNVLA